MSQQTIRSKGICKTFNTEKGFGFITLKDGSGDIFVHISEINKPFSLLSSSFGGSFGSYGSSYGGSSGSNSFGSGIYGGAKSLQKGEELEFYVVTQNDGRRKAVNVTGPNGTFIQAQKRNNYGDGIYRGRSSRGRGRRYMNNKRNSYHKYNTYHQQTTNYNPYGHNINNTPNTSSIQNVETVKNKQSKNILISVKVSGSTNDKIEPFDIEIEYNESIKIQDILNKIMNIINSNKYPKMYAIYSIYVNYLLFSNILIEQEKQRHYNVPCRLSTYNGWLSDSPQKQWNYFCSLPITIYDINKIKENGLNIGIQYRFNHKIKTNEINCSYISNKNDDIKNNDDSNGTMNPLQCPIYKAMRMENKFTENALNHLLEFVHFKDEYKDKPICNLRGNCPSFIRLENGGNRLDDRCHIKLYRHPPRTNRQIILSQNMNKYIICHPNQERTTYRPTSNENKQCNEKDGFLKVLIDEVVSNGFKYDLCLKCTKNDDCNHNDYSILNIVDQKMNHIRHKNIGQILPRDHMLALILYTGCDCNYDLCKSQRNNDYKKWKWFDYCLYAAIRLLSGHEKGSYKLYSGLNNVKLDKVQILNGHFPTYTSCSWIKEVSMSFMGNKGMIIEIDKEVREIFACCDVSWISKFPDECEVLISRQLNKDNNNELFFMVSILDQQNGVQTVSLTKKPSYTV